MAREGTLLISHGPRPSSTPAAVVVVVRWPIGRCLVGVLSADWSVHSVRLFSTSMAAVQLKTFFPFFQTPDNGPIFTFSYTPPRHPRERRRVQPPRCAACASGGHRPTARAARTRHLAGGVVHAHVSTPRAMTAPTAHGTNEIARRNSAKNRAATQPRNDASEFNNRSNSSGASACSSRGTDAATTSCRPRRRPRSQPVTRPATAHLPPRAGGPRRSCAAPRAPRRRRRGRRRGAAAAAAPP